MLHDLTFEVFPSVFSVFRSFTAFAVHITAWQQKGIFVRLAIISLAELIVWVSSFLRCKLLNAAVILSSTVSNGKSPLSKCTGFLAVRILFSYLFFTIRCPADFLLHFKAF